MQEIPLKLLVRSTNNNNSVLLLSNCIENKNLRWLQAFRPFLQENSAVLGITAPTVNGITMLSKLFFISFNVYWAITIAIALSLPLNRLERLHKSHFANFTWLISCSGLGTKRLISNRFAIKFMVVKLWHGVLGHGRIFWDRLSRIHLGHQSSSLFSKNTACTFLSLQPLAHFFWSSGDEDFLVYSLWMCVYL